MRGAAGRDRRDAMVDPALHEQRNRQPRNVFHHHDDRQHGHRRPGTAAAATPAVRGPRAARQRLVDGQVLVVGVLARDVPRHVVGGHRCSPPSASCPRAWSCSRRRRSHSSSSSQVVAALGTVVEFVVGGQQVAVLRHVGQQLGVGADVGDGAVARSRATRSASSTVDARCATTMPVTDRAAPGAAPRSTTASVCTSSADNVSSSTRMRGAGQDRAGQRKPLALTTGQAHALFADAGVQTERQVVDELAPPRCRWPRRVRSLAWRSGSAQPEVLGHRHGEQRRVLERGGHGLPQRGQAADRGCRCRRADLRPR